MVRFRPCGERSSTLEGSVAGESVPIADRCSRGKRLTPTSSREIATLSLRLALRPAPDRRSLRRLDFARSSRPLAKRLPLHLIARWTVDETWATVRQPIAHSRRRRIPSSAAIWMLDPSALAPAKEGQTLPRLVRRLGAYDVTTPRGRGSEEFGPLETIPHQQGTDPPSSPRKPRPRHDATLDQIPLAGIWSRTIARVGLK